MDEIEEAITKVIAGPEKKSRVISEKERRLTAFHEAGHAVVARSLPESDPVHQITIIPRGRAGGFTMTLPTEDRYYATKGSMREQIIHLLGGRVAEQLTLEDISTGASNDIQRATDIAKDMVTKYGFSEKLGPVNYSSSDEVFLGKDFSSKQNFSEGTAAEIDEEVRHIIESCYEEAKQILTDHMNELNEVAAALLAVETLDGAQFEKLYSGEMTAAQLEEHVNDREEELREKNAAEAEEAERLRLEEEAALERELAKYDTDYFADDEETDEFADDEEEAEEPAELAAPEAEETAETETPEEKEEK
jgi:cell division protease FtsH